MIKRNNIEQRSENHSILQSQSGVDIIQSRNILKSLLDDSVKGFETIPHAFENKIVSKLSNVQTSNKTVDDDKDKTKQILN